MPYRNLLITIDHHEARLYRCEDKGSHAQVIRPHDPHHIRSHLTHRNTNYAGQRAPEDPAFYKAVAAALRPADQILIIGHATGHSSAKLVLLKYLANHHQSLLERVIGVESVDQPTENQLLAHARAMFLKQAAIRQKTPRRVSEHER